MIESKFHRNFKRNTELVVLGKRGFKYQPLKRMLLGISLSTVSEASILSFIHACSRPVRSILMHVVPFLFLLASPPLFMAASRYHVVPQTAPRFFSIGVTSLRRSCACPHADTHTRYVLSHIPTSLLAVSHSSAYRQNKTTRPSTVSSRLHPHLFRCVFKQPRGGTDIPSMRRLVCLLVVDMVTC